MQWRRKNLQLLPDDEDFILPLGTDDFVFQLVVDTEGKEKILDFVEEDELLDDFFISTKRTAPPGR